MHHLIYLSTTTQAFREEELPEMLVRSRHNNERLGITGLLLYRHGSFLQALEGEREVVESLYVKITHDRRHHGLQILFNEKIPEREFPSWTMGFHDLSSLPLDGFNDLLNQPPETLALAGYPEKVRAFMRTFV
jgi:hypothetical protein